MKHIDRYKITVFAILALFLLWGFVSFRDYGISWDEEVQRVSGLGGLRTAIQLTLGQDAVPERLLEKDVAAIKSGSLGIKLPVLLIEYATGFRMTNEKVFKIYHLYNFLIFWISAVFVYPLLRELGFEEKYSITGLVLYIICPRILADAFYNIKDLIMLSVLTVCLYFCVAVVKDYSIKKAVCLGIVTGVAANVRTVSAFSVCLFALYYLVWHILSKDKKVILKTIRELAGPVVIAFVTLFLITPGMWRNPFGTLSKRVTSTFKFSHGGFENVAGIVMNRTELPWYYLPLSIILTVPCIYIIGVAVGLISFGAKGGKKDRNDHMLWILWGQLLFYLGYPIVMKPVQYNLWRHLYFIFIYMVIFIVYGIRALDEKGGRIKVCTRIFTAVSVALTVIWIGVNHPFEYLYFNPLFRGEAARNTDQDYWAVSYKGLLSQIVDGSEADVFIYPTLTGNLLFGEPGWDNYHLSTHKHSAKYRIEEGNPGDDNFYKILKTVEVDDRICESLIRRENYGNVLGRGFVENGVVSGETQGVNITCEGDRRHEIVLEIPGELEVYEVDFLFGPGAVSGEKVYVSEGGPEEQYLLFEDCLLRKDDILGVCRGETAIGGYLRMEYDSHLPDEEQAIEVRIFGREKGAEKNRGDVYYNRFDAGKYVSNLEVFGGGDLVGQTDDEAGVYDVASMTDGDEESVFCFGEQMDGDEQLSFEIAEGFGVLRGLHLGSGDNPLGSGRDMVIEVSSDGSSFSEMPWYYGAAWDYLFENAGEYRYIRIRQEGQSRHPWTVSELGLIKGL